MENGNWFRSMHCVYFIQGDIKNIEDVLSKYHEMCIKKYGKGGSPHPQDYRPEMDITHELDSYGIIRYQKFIGKLRREIELGPIDINTEISCLPQQLFSPREGHVENVYHIFRYLQVNLKNNLGRILCYGNLEQSSESFFEIGTQDKYQWKVFYPDVDKL